MKAFFSIITLAILISSCNNTATKQSSTTDTTQAKPANHPVLVENVLTKEERDRLTPDTVLQMLKDGNNNYVNDHLTGRLQSAQVRAASTGQYPEAIILSCIDSRVPVEDIFDKGIGDVFVARVAGNIVNEDILGSMEYACKVAGAKLVVVMGHTECGAVKGAIDNEKLGNLTALLSKIRPAIDSSKSFSGEKTLENKDYVNAVCKKNVQLTIKNIRQQSQILRDMEKNGDIKIVGAIYDVSTGKVTFM